MYGKITS